MIDGFDSILDTVRLAKELDNAGRNDIIQEHFFDELSCDAFYENTIGATMGIFAECHNNYDDVECVE
jgi:hypothetical protein